MTHDNDIGQLLREHLQQTADSRPADGALDEILVSTARIHPKRAFGSRLGMVLDAGLVPLGIRLSPAAARGLAFVLVALLLAAIAGTSLLGRKPDQPAVVVPTSPPTISPSPPLSPTARPSLAVAVTPPPIQLASTFTSPLYHYTIGLGTGWTTRNATIPINSPKSTDATAFDELTARNTDTTIEIAGAPLGKESFLASLKDIQTAALHDPNTPSGCDGGDPSTWPAVTIGQHQGLWQQMCNYAVAYVDVGGRSYSFAWSNGTFDNSQHLSVSDFKVVLKSVVFP
jgi:hypothetical protein